MFIAIFLLEGFSRTPFLVNYLALFQPLKFRLQSSFCRFKENVKDKISLGLFLHYFSSNASLVYTIQVCQNLSEFRGKVVRWVGRNFLAATQILSQFR